MPPPTCTRALSYDCLVADRLSIHLAQAVRNFVQLCLESYYDKTIFHRIIKDFMVQGGDPTGTGTGESLPKVIITIVLEGRRSPRDLLERPRRPRRWRFYLWRGVC